MKTFAFQVADETSGLGGWKTVHLWRINPEGEGMDHTGPKGVVHHDWAMDAETYEFFLESMYKPKCDATHRWVEVAGDGEEPTPEQKGRHPDPIQSSPSTS